MKNTIYLPLSEPTFSTYHYQGTDGIVSAANPYIHNFTLNRRIVLLCTQKFLTGFSSPELTICDTAFWANPYVEQYSVDLHFIQEDPCQVICQMLAEGYYVYFEGVDDFYVKGKSFYQQRHFSHDGMIHGFNSDVKMFNLYAYNQQWRYRSFETPMADFLRGLTAVQTQQTVPSRLVALKAKPDLVALEPKTIENHIRYYLTPNLHGENNSVMCISVQTLMEDYLQLLETGTIPYEKTDWRIFRLLWEHKKCMLERMIAIENLLWKNNKFSSPYNTDIVKEMNVLRLIYARHTTKREDALLSLLQNRLQRLTIREQEILTDFLHAMEQENL